MDECPYQGRRDEVESGREPARGRLAGMVKMSPAFVDALSYAEERIQALVASLDRPIEGLAQPGALTLGIARQAGAVHRDLITLCASNRLTSPVILVRPIVEAAILVRWIEVDPQPHTDMYFAEDDRQRLSSVPAFVEFRRRRGTPMSGPVFSPDVEAEMRKGVTDVKAAAIAAGKITKKSNRVLPLIQDMAKATGDSAIWEGYQVIYRVASPWTHFGGRAMSHYEPETRSDGTHLVPAPPYDGLAIRGLTAPTMLVLLGSVSRICGLGIEREARILQDTIAMWPSEALGDVDL